MSEDSSTVGIIVPCHNQGRFAEECIASLRIQTYQHWRAVVVDDGSTDGSGAVLDRLAGGVVEVVHLRKNVGLPAARNAALRKLRDVEFILPVDCDDYLNADYLERLVPTIQENAEIGLVHGTLVTFGEPHPHGFDRWPPADFVDDRRYFENQVPGPGSLLRAVIVRQLGGWNESFHPSGAADWDLWLRVVESGWRLAWVREAVYHYRQHPESMTSKTDARRRVWHHRNILRFHARQIESSVGVRAFLDQRLLPAFYDDIHGRHWRDAAVTLASLVRHAPMVAFRSIRAHYANRLVSREGQ